MLTKTDPDEIQPFLSDASYVSTGIAEELIFPENPGEVAEILKDATANGRPVTISGAGTGTVAGRIPAGGTILATDKGKDEFRLDRSW